MRHFAKWTLASVALLMSISLAAQDVQRDRDPKFMARLSYDTTPPPTKGEELQHVCIAVTRDGDYRTIRQMQGEETQRMRGKLPSAEFEQLKKFLESPKF